MLKEIGSGLAVVLLLLGLMAGCHVVAVIRDELRRWRRRRAGLKFHRRLSS